MNISTKGIRLLVILASALAFSTQGAHAQRVLEGQSVVNVQFSPAAQAGVTAGWSICDQLGQTSLTVSYLTDDVGKFLSAEEMAQVKDGGRRAYDIFASGGYFFRIVSTRSRSVMLYGGGTLDLGYRGYDFELWNQKETIDDEGYLILDRTEDRPYLSGHFIYGFSPEIGVQAFPARKVAVSLFARPRMRFNRKGGEPWFVPAFGVGLHFYI